jgi:hypothetical protein
MPHTASRTPSCFDSDVTLEAINRFTYLVTKCHGRWTPFMLRIREIRASNTDSEAVIMIVSCAFLSPSRYTHWSVSPSKCYLRIQSVPQREHHTSPLQRSTG